VELEQLQAQWRLLDQKMEQTLAVQAALLQRAHMQTAQRHLTHLAFWPVIDLMFGAFVLVVSGSCLGDHWTSPSLALPAAGLMVAAIVFSIGNLRQLAFVRNFAWDGPIAAIQTTMTRLRRARIQQFKWVILLSPLVWFAAMCVGGAVLFGGDLVRSADRAWVIGNIVFGIAFIPGGIVLTRVASNRWRERSFWKNVLDGISGRSLVEAQRELDQWSELANDRTIEQH
jgi:hypothetical protein